MEGMEEHDNCLCQEILVLEPFKYKKGSNSRSQIWEKIANNLNGLKLPRFKVSKRAVRERHTLLSEKFKSKMKDKEKASGIKCNLSELEKALEEKRQRNEEEENANPKQKSRRSGGDTIAYLRKKIVLVQKWKEEELQLQKLRVEVECKREDQSRNQHQDMMKILLEQAKQQKRADAKLSADVYLNATAAVSNNYEASRKKLTWLDLHRTVHNIFDFVVNTCFSI